MTGNWASYSWPPAIVLVSVTVIFLMDLFVERFVEMKYGSQHDHNVESMITRTAHNHGPNSEEHTVSAMIDEDLAEDMIQQHTDDHKMLKTPEGSLDLEKAETLELLGFRQQIAAFLILEFGVIFHSVIIGKLSSPRRCVNTTEEDSRTQSGYGWIGVHHIVPCSRLPSIVRGSRYWCSYVRDPVPKRPEVASVCLMLCIWLDHPHRNRHRTWLATHL